MSNYRKNNKKKKNRNNFNLEALEPRLMLSATAEEAVQDYISSSVFVDYVKQNVTELGSNTIQVDGQNLSVEDLLKGSFKVSENGVKVTRDGDSDSYAVTGDVVLSNPSVELSIDINGQSVTGLTSALNTSVKIDDLTLEITEEDNVFSVKDGSVTGDVSLESDIVVDEAAGAKANDGYLDFGEQNVSTESESDLKIKVSSDKNGATISLDSYDLEFNVKNSVVTFDPNMKVKGISHIDTIVAA